MWKKIVCFGSLSLVAAMLLFTLPAKATTMVYTDEASFLSVLKTPYYLQNFAGNTTGGTYIPLNKFDPGSGYGYTVTASATGELYGTPGGLSTGASDEKLQIAFTGAPVTAVGGFFWPTDSVGNNLTGGITLTLSDGTKYTIPGSSSSTFIGFATNNGPAFTSLSIQTVNPNPDGAYYLQQFPTMNHFYVGADPVPEPSSLILLGSGLVGLGFYASNRRWRKK